MRDQSFTLRPRAERLLGRKFNLSVGIYQSYTHRYTAIFLARPPSPPSAGETIMISHFSIRPLALGAWCVCTIGRRSTATLLRKSLRPEWRNGAWPPRAEIALAPSAFLSFLFVRSLFRARREYENEKVSAGTKYDFWPFN